MYASTGSFLQVAAEVAAPISQCKRIVMVSSGKGEVGAGKLTGEVIDIITKTTSMVHQLTGVNVGSACGKDRNLASAAAWNTKTAQAAM
ncbi:hypothetical protein HPB50_002733 [Hyalomma asiaticum]|uniref:Uncharacterized protein n=1 Tax=Hyalomma asiaticum TaxID=266040 RepID=A0ACB7TDN4_HYAAI|nr:hypothetical protein HPB50_002733 [Hyalomma asiaticum]